MPPDPLIETQFMGSNLYFRKMQIFGSWAINEQSFSNPCTSSQLQLRNFNKFGNKLS